MLNTSMWIIYTRAVWPQPALYPLSWWILYPWSTAVSCHH